MRPLLLLAILALLVAPAARPAFVAAHPVPRAAAADLCTCAAARAENSWCAVCKAGYVAGVRMASAELFEVIDAHGHAIDADHMPCAQCRAAYAAAGWCDDHATGFAGGRGYVSRLAWLLARGDAEAAAPEVAKLRAAVALESTCHACAAAAFTDGRCPRCDIRYVDAKPVPGRRAAGTAP